MNHDSYELAKMSIAPPSAKEENTNGHHQVLYFYGQHSDNNP